MNFLIETKQEYTIHLVNSIYQLIYEGLTNIYDEANKTAKNNDELKVFQILLSSVPKWNPNIIDSEYQRIIRLNNLGKTIEDLLKAVIKSNIVVLTNTNIDYDEKLLNELNIIDDFKHFIHFVYIECARTFYNSPFLFSHRESPIDIKRNQSEILKIIQECIKNAIRKMIPLQVTIKTYLENKSNNIPTDLQSESKQIKNLLISEKNRKTETMLTPSSPKKFHEIFANSANSDELKNSNSILKNNNKMIQLTDKTLRDSILGINTEVKNDINNIFINNNSKKEKYNKKNHLEVSESSVYYEPSKNNVIEEYNNLKPKGLDILKETEQDMSSEQNNKKNKDKNYKYFSHLNV